MSAMMDPDISLDLTIDDILEDPLAEESLNSEHFIQLPGYYWWKWLMVIINSYPHSSRPFSDREWKIEASGLIVVFLLCWFSQSRWVNLAIYQKVVISSVISWRQEYQNDKYQIIGSIIVALNRRDTQISIFFKIVYYKKIARRNSFFI